MILYDDIYLHAWCNDCGYPSQIPGSTPMIKISCTKCNSKNLVFEHVMSEKSIEKFTEAYSKKKKK
jgi:hypothetical protein